jgi:hypothetical protein
MPSEKIFKSNIVGQRGTTMRALLKGISIVPEKY